MFFKYTYISNNSDDNHSLLYLLVVINNGIDKIANYDIHNNYDKYCHYVSINYS